MKNEYDFSKAERGKFYNKNADMNIPVYLESDVRDFVNRIAENKHQDTSTIVNRLLKKDMDIAGVID